MTVEEIEAIVGGYHGDSFRILGPHGVRKKSGPAALGSPRVPAAGRVGRSRRRRRALPDGEEHAQGFFCAALNGAARRLPHPRAPVGRPRRSRSTTPTASARRSPTPTSTCTPKARSTRLAHARRAPGRRSDGVRRRAIRRVGAECRKRHRRRRVQRLGRPPPPDAAAQRRRLGDLHPRPRRGRVVQVQRPLALRRLPAAEGRPVRVLLRDAAEIRVRGLGHRQIRVAGRGVDGGARQDRLAEVADLDLRGAPGIVDARPAGAAAHLSRDGGEAGGVRQADGLHAHRAAAHHGASVLRLVGLPGDRLFRADLALRHARRLQVLRRLPATRRASA